MMRTGVPSIMLACMLLAGCAAGPPRHWEQARSFIGQSQAEVVAQLGEPSRRESIAPSAGAPASKPDWDYCSVPEIMAHMRAAVRERWFYAWPVSNRKMETLMLEFDADGRAVGAHSGVEGRGEAVP